MKFLLDMGISIHLAPHLRSDGHEAAHIADRRFGWHLNTTTTTTDLLRVERSKPCLSS